MAALMAFQTGEYWTLSPSQTSVRAFPTSLDVLFTGY